MTWEDLVKEFEAEWIRQRTVLEHDVKLGAKTLKLMKYVARQHYMAGHNAGIASTLPAGAVNPNNLKLGRKQEG